MPLFRATIPRPKRYGIKHYLTIFSYNSTMDDVVEIVEQMKNAPHTDEGILSLLDYRERILNILRSKYHKKYY